MTNRFILVLEAAAALLAGGVGVLIVNDCKVIEIAPLAGCGALTLQVLTDAENFNHGDAQQRTQLVHANRPGPGIEAAPLPDT